MNSALRKRFRVLDQKVISNEWATLSKITLEYHRNNATLQKQVREIYDRGNGAVILLYDSDRRTVILVKQFRYPVFINGFEELFIEAPAGALDEAEPIERIRKEVEEETGYRITEIK